MKHMAAATWGSLDLCVGISPEMASYRVVSSFKSGLSYPLKVKLLNDRRFTW